MTSGLAVMIWSMSFLLTCMFSFLRTFSEGDPRGTVEGVPVGELLAGGAGGDVVVQLDVFWEVMRD
jgi:hypothetical protein